MVVQLGHEGDSGFGEILRSGSNCQHEVTIESSSLIGVDEGGIGIELALCGFNCKIHRLRRTGSNVRQ